MKLSINQIDFEKGGGIVPVVVQEEKTGKILMLAYANKEAVERTVTTGFAHYYSRSRKRLWKKGEESGNVQKVKKVLLDCDRDSLVYVVKQKGNACHTGEKSCFFNEIDTSNFV
jgi:phosphoribosyl-AMP cyclohydrolase